MELKGVCNPQKRNLDSKLPAKADIQVLYVVEWLQGFCEADWRVYAVDYVASMQNKAA